MKALLILCFGLLLLAGDRADAQVPPASVATELRTQANGADYGKFDGRGKLVFQELYQDDYPAEWHYTLAYYPRGRRQSVKLQRNITAINVFLATEIRQPDTVRTFLKEYLMPFLVDNLGDPPTGTISLRSVDAGMGSELSSSAAEQARRKAKIRTYARSTTPVIVGNSWTVDVNVLTDNGAVEHWLIKGRVMPLQIDSFLCEPKEPDGTFQPLAWIR